jgi:hypothetical protein
MSDSQFLARLSWILGGALAVLGAALWFVIPIRPMFPPYLATALLALGYGTFCWRRARAAANRRKP